MTARWSLEELADQHEIEQLMYRYATGIDTADYELVDSVFTADMGEHLAIALHYLRVRAQGDFLTCLGFGSMRLIQRAAQFVEFQP